ncbi:MAG: 16S rRNA (cytosine(967)-C(5))-methyltransferase RsmB [Peptococcaceae bacterium]|jgi:16S rRNA (cytosine967-C5)-methyltransferase|nr:16S rRNA (cytosine(967)-C(5))-methyltransferase RsmB [Peptococcaceae bacterium]
MVKYTARALAVQILTRVEQEEAYANLLLRYHLPDLEDSRERNLATALVNGSLKNRLLLDYALRGFLSKPLSALPHAVRWILRTAAWQILFLDHIPVAAAVNEAVELCKENAARYAALVNSVLRRVAERGWNIAWPDERRESARYLSVRYSHPEWLVKRWLKRWGWVETEALCRWDNEPAQTWIRANRLRMDREGLLEILRREGLTAETGERAPDSMLLRDPGMLTRWESFRQGYFSVQDESSQLAVCVLDPRPGERVLDVCAAPGGKSAYIAERMSNRGRVVACDIHGHKLSLIRETAERLGLEIIEAREQDARHLPEEWQGKMDRVLVDAPCSGFGVLRRKADLRWRKQERALDQFPALQESILHSAAQCVAPDGVLVYCTCTLEPEENFELVKAFRREHAEFTPEDLSGSLPFTLSDPQDIKQEKKGVLQLLPHKHGMDGFFLAKFRRNGV